MPRRSRELLVATFPDEAALRRGLRLASDRGIQPYDAYAPYPLHGLRGSIERRHSRLPFATLVGGLLGGAAAIAMQFYMAVLDWPLDVGGKPANSTLAFVPIAFELTILCASLGCAAAFLIGSRLTPVPRRSPFVEGATEDVFALAVRYRNEESDAANLKRLLFDGGANRVVIVRPAR